MSLAPPEATDPLADALAQLALLRAENAASKERAAALLADNTHKDRLAFVERCLRFGADAAATNAKTLTRGAATTTSADALLKSLPPADADAVALEWAAFRSRELGLGDEASLAGGAATASLSENRDVHPLIERLLRAALRAGGGAARLRLWHERKANDDAASRSRRPDFTLTSRDDALPTTLGGLVSIEIKRPGDKQSAVSQAAH